MKDSIKNVLILILTLFIIIGAVIAINHGVKEQQKGNTKYHQM